MGNKIYSYLKEATFFPRMIEELLVSNQGCEILTGIVENVSIDKVDSPVSTVSFNRKCVWTVTQVKHLKITVV